MWILPSRGRPESVQRFFDAYKATGATTRGICVYDLDDYHNYTNIRYPLGWHGVVTTLQNQGIGAIQNEAFYAHPTEPWYGYISDDMVPRTPQWDTKLVEAAGIDSLAVPNDLMHNGALATVAVIGGEMARDLGWLCLPGLKRLYGDNVVTEYAKHHNRYYYLSDVVVEHLHFSNGKAPKDATYHKPREQTNEDKRIYEEWLSKLKSSA